MSTLAIHSALYKEHLGNENLSRKFKSNQVFSPANFDRFTISDLNFKRYFDAAPKVPKTPWGRSHSYGGLGRVNLPDQHRSKWEPPHRVEKGHLHYGAGVMPHLSGMKIQQFYSLTPLSKSKVRSNDQLLPSPNQENIANSQVDAKFPAEHPYSSHSSRYALFPVFDTPTDMKRGEEKHLYQPTLPPETPASAPVSKIIGKSRGSPARREEVPVSRSSDRSPLKWLDGPNFYQLPKGPEKERQNYYPCPPSTVRPASGALLQNTAVTPKTADSLNNIQKAMWVSTYKKDFTGRAELEPNGIPTNNNSVNDDNWNTPLNIPISVQQEAFMKNSSEISDHFQSIELDKSNVQELSRRSSLDTLDINEAGWDADARTRSGKSELSATPKSVQFRRSVTFSDGKSMKEIPLNNSTSPRSENTIAHYPKTPFPGHSSPAAFGREALDSGSHKEANSKAERMSKSVNNMPSQQVKESNLIFDPACPPKFFRPHTVGCPRSSTELLKVRDNWSKSAASRKFYDEHPESTPDLRRKPDLRFTDNERRHVVPEAKAHTYLFRGSDHM